MQPKKFNDPRLEQLDGFRVEVDAAQAYFVCDNPAFSMTLQENNSLLVGKKLYRIQSIKKQ